MSEAAREANNNLMHALALDLRDHRDRGATRWTYEHIRHTFGVAPIPFGSPGHALVCAARNRALQRFGIVTESVAGEAYEILSDVAVVHSTKQHRRVSSRMKRRKMELATVSVAKLAPQDQMRFQRSVMIADQTLALNTTKALRGSNPTSPPDGLHTLKALKGSNR